MHDHRQYYMHFVTFYLFVICYKFVIFLSHIIQLWIQQYNIGSMQQINRTDSFRSQSQPVNHNIPTDTNAKGVNHIDSNRQPQVSKIQPLQISNPPTPPSGYKNLLKLSIIAFSITLSAFYFGFSLTYLGTIPKQTLAQFYGKIIYSTSTLPVLSGAMPVGGIFGSLLANILMRFYTRKRFIIWVNFVALGVNCLIQITNIWVLLVCRFVNGLLVGLYMGVVPSYVKELSPHSLSGTFGAFTQLQHLVGNVVSYLFGTIFYLCNYEGQFMMRFQFQFTTVLIVVQMVLLVTGFIPQSPNSLIMENKVEQAKEVIRMFYPQDQVETVIAQKIHQNSGHKIQQFGVAIRQFYQRMKMSKQQRQIKKSLQVAEQEQQQPQVQMTPRSWFLSFQLPLTQQLTGTNFIVTQMTAITALFDQPLSHFTGLIANALQLVSTAFSALILKRVGRRPVILIGNISIGVLDVAIGIVFMALNKLSWGPGFAVGMALIGVFNVLYGLTLGPVIWLYIPEIAQKRIVPLATATYWIGCSFCVIVPPIITTIMNSPYAVFLFFGVYEILVFWPNLLLVLQTKGLSAAQISRKFKQGH